jgi:UrcA family protein
MRYLPLAALTAVLAATSAPAFAQDLEEVIVSGHGRNPTSLSQTVSFADLDLNMAGDRQVLRQRIVSTARSICNQLGEPSPPMPGNLGRSCQEVAVRDAMDQVRIAVADAGANRAFAANDAGAYGESASATVGVAATNGPIPDTAANRARYGGPASAAGQRSRPRGN